MYDKDGSWDGDDGYDFDYTVDKYDLIEGLTDILYKKYFNDKYFRGYIGYYSAIRRGLKEFIENDLKIEQLVEDFNEELKEYFEDIALESIE